MTGDRRNRASPDNGEGGPPGQQQPAPHHAETPSPSTAAEVLHLSVPDAGEHGQSTTPVPDLTVLPLLIRAAAAGHPPVRAAVPPFLARRLDEHDRRAADGIVLRCRHLRRGGAGPAVLLVWDAPGRLRCGPCALEAQSRLHGTVEDHRCDCCGELVERLYMFVVLARGYVIPVGICASCRSSGQAGPA